MEANLGFKDKNKAIIAPGFNNEDQKQINDALHVAGQLRESNTEKMVPKKEDVLDNLLNDPEIAEVMSIGSTADVNYIEKGHDIGKESSENVLYAQYPEIRKIVETTSDADVNIEIDERMAKEAAQTEMEVRMKREQIRRDVIKARNIRNFKEVVRMITRNEMLDPKHAQTVVNAVVAELNDESSSLAGMMEDPRIILDKIVPDAIEEIRSMEKADGHYTH